MRPLNYLIVELDEAYDNEVQKGEHSIIINSTIESVERIKRIATVVSAPDFTILQKGDEVIVHHNIFRLRNSTTGNITQSDYHIEGNQYFVPLTEIFMFRRDDSDWNAISPYCYVKPIIAKEKEGFQLSYGEEGYKGRVNHKGIMSYPNTELEQQGVTKGTPVTFSKNSEYEFEIEGELFYKMSTRDILTKE